MDVNASMGWAETMPVKRDHVFVASRPGPGIRLLPEARGRESKGNDRRSGNQTVECAARTSHKIQR